jgi:hypothetical protein
MPECKTVPLYEIAHGRTGDKGDRANISVIAYDQDHYAVIAEQITLERVAELFAHRPGVEITRYELPNLWALNFVLDNVLEGGVNSSLNLDGHGKALAYLVLSLEVELPRS